LKRESQAFQAAKKFSVEESISAGQITAATAEDDKEATSFELEDFCSEEDNAPELEKPWMEEEKTAESLDKSKTEVPESLQAVKVSIKKSIAPPARPRRKEIFP